MRRFVHCTNAVHPMPRHTAMKYSNKTDLKRPTIKRKQLSK